VHGLPADRLLAAIVESSDDIIVSKTLQGIITSWNAAAERILGYTAEEAIGNPIMLIVPPELADQEREIIEKISRGERVDHMETVRVAKDGRRIPLSLTISPVRDAVGNIVGASKIARDISQQKRIEAEREEALRRAEKANRVKDEFLATLSHELRNPLNAIMGWAPLLKSGSLPPEQTKRAWETVERNLEAEVQLISDLLDLSRIVAGRLRLDIRPFELIGLVEEAIEVFRPAAEAKGIRLDCLLDPTAGPIAGDPNRLRQVLSNLISNSLKFTPKRGRIQVLLQRVDSVVEITVRDSGIGIEKDFLRQIFEPFRQYDGTTAREFTGLGLGLSIVQQIVQLHGGCVRAHSDGLGKGASFAVRLPLLVVAEPASEQRTEAPFSTGELRSREIMELVRGLRVLVIDDDPDARNMMDTLLAQAGVDVRTAEGVDSALTILDCWVPNVVLCDIGMPGQDGYAFIRRLRDRAPNTGGRLPAAALTAYARVEDRVQILASGFQMHLPKPVRPQELFASVAALATLRSR
jgi:PAS domain S-box-containing protein